MLDFFSNMELEVSGVSMSTYHGATKPRTYFGCIFQQLLLFFISLNFIFLNLFCIQPKKNLRG